MSLFTADGITEGRGKYSHSFPSSLSAVSYFTINLFVQASLCSEMASELRSALKCPSGGSAGAGGAREGADSPYLHYGFSTKSQLH